MNAPTPSAGHQPGDVVRYDGNPHGPLMTDLARTGRVGYIDRRGPWGNPWKTGRTAGVCAITHDEAVAEHRRWLTGDWPDVHRVSDGREVARTRVLAHVGDLRGKVLACWCTPNPCHGHTLAELARQASR